VAVAAPSDDAAVGIDADAAVFLELSGVTGAGLAGTTIVIVADCSPQKN
jgi:hypothetical protein